MAFKFNEYHLGGAGGGVIEPITIKQNGTYNATEGVDGYAPITVDVAGSGGGGDNTVIDVESLPTENVDDSKIYRMTETTEPSGEIYVYAAGFTDSPITLPEYAKLDGVPFDINTIYHVVDSAPAVSEMLLSDESTFTLHVYIVLETGENYMTMDGVEVVNCMEAMFGIGHDFFVGTAHSLDEMTQNGYYFLVTEGNTYSVYGLPNSNTDKKFYEYNDSATGWEECDSGDRLIVDVPSFPTENIDDTKVYRIKTKVKEQLDVVMVSESTGAMTMSNLCSALKNFGFTTSLNYYVVDELPSSPAISVRNNSSKIAEFHIYILQDTGEPYVSTDGTTCVLLGKSGVIDESEYFGIINDIDKATAFGYYTLICKEGFKYSYGVSNTADNKRLFEYDGEWKDTSAFKGEIENLNAEIENLSTEVDTLNQTIDENEPYANFAKYATLEPYTSGSGATAVQHVSLSNMSNKDVESVYIPNGVELIGEKTFQGCVKLKSVTLPQGLVSTGQYAFDGCQALTNIENFSGNLGIYAFKNCTSLTEVTIPGNAVGKGVFHGCSKLHTVTFTNEGFSLLGVEAFYKCINLKTINFNGTKASWKSVQKSEWWDTNTPNYTVYCSDGTIAKDGTET